VAAGQRACTCCPSGWPGACFGRRAALCAWAFSVRVPFSLILCRGHLLALQSSTAPQFHSSTAPSQRPLPTGRPLASAPIATPQRGGKRCSGRLERAGQLRALNGRARPPSFWLSVGPSASACETVSARETVCGALSAPETVSCRQSAAHSLRRTARAKSVRTAETVRASEPLCCNEDAARVCPIR